MVPDDSVERALSQIRILDAFRDGTCAAGRLWVAFSGGVDSTVLLHALRTVSGTVAIHIDHGLDPSAPDWVRHCAAVTQEFGVEFESRSVDVDSHGNREQAARAARYAAFGELLAPGDVLALGHHGDDQAETRVWQLLTGREPGGMPTERRLGAGWLVRPLMGVKREQILDYARRHDLRWIEDPANADVGFDRNAIRHGVLRRLEERHPGALDRLSAPRRAAVECLRPLSVDEASGRGIEAWLLAAGLPKPSKAVREIRRQSRADADRVPQVRVVPGLQAWRHGNAWHLVADRAVSSRLDSLALGVGADWAGQAGSLTWRRAEWGLDAGLALSMRLRHGGERIRPQRRNRTKSVKALFQEARVPPWQRADWPLLYAGDELAAVPSLAVADGFAKADGWEPRWTPR
ncbi:MAG: tRNA lysidine(34) synthetase TilS [Gammaproteobacteria bacterium]|nr:tRNA lysidine(34) synthetase TilS [Gammaproteobacteria bacterium]